MEIRSSSFDGFICASFYCWLRMDSPITVSSRPTVDARIVTFRSSKARAPWIALFSDSPRPSARTRNAPAPGYCEPSRNPSRVRRSNLRRQRPPLRIKPAELLCECRNLRPTNRQKTCPPPRRVRWSRNTFRGRFRIRRLTLRSLKNKSPHATNFARPFGGAKSFRCLPTDQTGPKAPPNGRCGLGSASTPPQIADGPRS